MRELKITVLALLSVFLLLVAAVSIVPYFISTPFGTAFLTERINKRIQGRMEVESIHLSLFGTQHVTNLKLYDATNKLIFSVENAQSQTSLLSFLYPSCSLGATLIEKPYVVLIKDSHARTNFEQALCSKKEKNPEECVRKSRWRRPCACGHLVIHEGTLQLASPKIKPVLIENLDFSYTPQLDTFHLNAKTNQGGVQGGILITGNTRNKLQIAAQIDHFPVALFDQLSEEALFTTALGETLNAKIDTTQNESNIVVTATMASDNLSGTVHAEVIGSTIRFVPDSQIIYTLSPATFEALIGPEQRKQWRLTSRVPITLSLAEGHLPRSIKSWSVENTVLKAALTLDRAELINSVFGPYSLSQFVSQIQLHDGFSISSSGKLQGKTEGQIALELTGNLKGFLKYNLKSEQFPFILLDLVMDEAEVLEGALGSAVTLDVVGTHDQGKSKTRFLVESSVTQLEGTIEGQSLQNLEFILSGKRVLQNEWEKTFGSTITLKGSGKAGFWDKNLAMTALKGTLSNDLICVNVQGRLGEKNQPFSREQVQLTANGTLLKLPYPELFPDTKLGKGLFVATLDGKENILKGSIKLQVSVDQKGGRIDSKTSQIEVTAKEVMRDKLLDLKQAMIEVEANLQQFPVPILDLFIPGHFDLSMVTGPVIDAAIHGTYTPQDHDHLISMNVDASSNTFKAQFGVTVDGTLTINQPGAALIEMEISPAQYKRLMQWLNPEASVDFPLSHSVKLAIALSQFQCPARKPDSLSSLICQSGLFGSITASPMIFASKNQNLVVKDFLVILQAENISQALTINLNATMEGSTIPAGTASHIKLSGELRNLWNHQGQIVPGALTVLGQTQLAMVPIRQVLGMLPMQAQTRKTYRALLGDYMNGQITGNVEGGTGPLHVDLKASNFKAVLPLQLTPHAILLREAIEAEVTLTEEVSEVLLVDVNPLLITGAHSGHPLRLTVDPNGFSFPIHPFTFKGINIDQAVLDIGKIQVQNGGQIQSLIDFLKASDITGGKWMNAWFTPIYMSLKDGTSYYKRFDILLAESVQIALWGQIDLVKNKVRMILGISPATLAQRFGVSGLSNKDMFQVKMRGKTDDVELDWSSAYTRMGIIVARLTGGHFAYLVGGVIDQLISVFGEETTPPPTTDPLPWEGQERGATAVIPPVAKAEEPRPLYKRALRSVANFLMP